MQNTIKSDPLTPPLILRIDLIRAGDILLTRGDGLESKGIARFSGGKYSHAALIINQGMTFESDGGLIRHKLIERLGWGILGKEQIPIGAISGAPEIAEIYRHGGMETIPQDIFDAMLKLEFKELYGLDYSEYHRLVKISNLPEPLKSVSAEIIKWYEKYYSPDMIPGPFCSELVARFFSRLNLRLFEVEKRPENISPNDLAQSNLAAVPGAVVESKLINEVHESPVAQIFTQEHSDVLATLQRNYRGTQKFLNEFNALGEKIKTDNQKTLETLCLSLLDTLKDVLWIAKTSEQLNLPVLLRRANRLCSTAIDLTSEFADITIEHTQDTASLGTLFEKLLRFQRSLVQTNALLSSVLVKVSFVKKKGLLVEFRRRRARAKFRDHLKEIRKLNIGALKTQEFIRSLLKSDSKTTV